MTIETPGGADWELGEAARKLSVVLGVEGAQADALRLALSDHAAAVGSKSTQMIAALMTPVLQAQLDTKAAIARMAEQSTRVALRQENADVASLKWRADLREHIDRRFDNFGTELDELKTEIIRLGGLEARVERVEVGQAKLEIRVEAVETHGAPAETINELHQLRTEVEKIRQMLILTRRQLWFTFAAVTAIALIFVLAILAGGGR